MHWRWNKCTGAPNSLSVTCNSWKQWLRPCQLLSRGYSLVGKKSLHSLAVVLLAIMQGPANIPFKPRVGGGGRKRPSISWLVENIYDWPVPQRSLAGRAPTGESKTAQNTNDAWSVLVRGYNWDKETDWAMQIASWCWSEWIPSGVSIDPAKEDSKKTCNCSVMISCMPFTTYYLVHYWNCRLFSRSTENLLTAVLILVNNLRFQACLIWGFPAFVCVAVVKVRPFLGGFECCSRYLKMSALFPGILYYFLLLYRLKMDQSIRQIC